MKQPGRFFGSAILLTMLILSLAGAHAQTIEIIDQALRSRVDRIAAQSSVRIGGHRQGRQACVYPCLRKRPPRYRR